MIPNYVAVNYYNYGDLFRAVDELNGFRISPYGTPSPQHESEADDHA